MHYKTFNQDRVLLANPSKEELAKWMGIDKYSFDYALPQEWLNRFVDENNLDYETVRRSTFCAYPKESTFGVIVSGITEIDEKISQNGESGHFRETQADLPLEWQDKEFDLLCRKLQFEMRQYFKRTGNRKYTIEFSWQDDKPKIIAAN